ncbi:MAG: murein biosynthesis integral membrane protein MurJ [Pseudomonadales bacterium]|jgi:putative peptidoglycan lipid II flippase|nr:murein biosynthesis integral membrane protein MurJ [Pseudomonadales bacterium]
MPTPPDTVNKPPPARSLLGSGAVVGGMTMLSRILGLVRDVVIAVLFGARPEADAFFVAFRIPNLFRRLFAEGAFSQGFVPVLAEYRARRTLPEVRTLVAHVSGLLGLALLAVTVLGALGADYVLDLFAPGFGEGDGRAELAAQMLRITFPYLLLISLTALCGGVLNAYGRFAVPAFTPVWLNVCLILAALGLAPRLDEPVMALAWGVLLAGIAQLLFQFPTLARLRLLALPRPSLRDDGVRRVWRLMLPAAFGASVGQLNLLIDTLLASFLQAGSIAWLYYADRLMELPLGIFAIALSTVLLPSLSREHALADGARFGRMLDAGLRLGLLLTVPAATALVVLAVPLIATLFGHGVMSDGDVLASARALQAYALGLLGFTGVKILAPGFFARQDTRTPVRIAVAAMFVNLVLNLLLIGPLAHVGLALATSIAACVNAALLLRGLRRDGVFAAASGWPGFLARLLAACVCLGAALTFAAPPAESWLARPLPLRIAWLLGLVTGGVLIYFGVLAALGYGPRRLISLTSLGAAEAAEDRV